MYRKIRKNQSIPTILYIRTFKKTIKGTMQVIVPALSHCGGIGRHKGLKIPW